MAGGEMSKWRRAYRMMVEKTGADADATVDQVGPVEDDDGAQARAAEPATKPTKVAIQAPAMYPPVGLGICAVPVLPATV